MNRLVTILLLSILPSLRFASKALVVNMADQAFMPSVVRANVGQRIIWTNNSNHAHDVTSMNGDFHSGVIEPHQHYSRVFTKPGTYYYSCSKHSILSWGMKGKIVVSKV